MLLLVLNGFDCIDEEVITKTYLVPLDNPVCEILKNLENKGTGQLYYMDQAVNDLQYWERDFGSNFEYELGDELKEPITKVFTYTMREDMNC